MMGIDEKGERRELPCAVADAGRLARGLDQLLESMAHADQLDPLDVKGVLALRSISQRCAERTRDAARILEAQNEILYAEERATTGVKALGALRSSAPRGGDIHQAVRASLVFRPSGNTAVHYGIQLQCIAYCKH